MSDRPGGLLVPLTTPFDPTTGEVAPISLRDNARHALSAGASGIVVGGSTGEAPMLDDAEFHSIVEWLRDVVDADRWLIAGTGRESTRATIVACRSAAECGADAVLVRTPSYYAPSISSSALLDHFDQVADESPVPILLYNIPKYTNLPIADGLVGSLAHHDNIWGAKDSSGDLKIFSAYRDAAPGWTMFMGSASLCYAALELGAAGTIAAVGCFAPGAVAAICAAFADGDRPGAGSIQESVAPLHTHIVGKMGVGGVKAAMDAVGLYGGPVRPPLSSVPDRDADRVRKLLNAAGVQAVDVA